MTVRRHGIAVGPLPAWDVRLYRRPAVGEECTFSIVHAGNFPLPRRRGDFGSGAVELMAPDNVFLCLFEYEPSASTTPMFSVKGRPRVTASDFSPHALQRTLRGQSGVQFFFTESDRAFCLYIVLGSHARRRRLVGLANHVIESLVIA